MSDLAKAFGHAVRSVVGPLDYHALYLGTIVKDHGDAHVDVRPADARLPAMTRLKLPALPLFYELNAGAQALIGFDVSLEPVIVTVLSGSLKRLEATVGASRILAEPSRLLLVSGASSVELTKGALTLDGPVINLGKGASTPVLLSNRKPASKVKAS